MTMAMQLFLVVLGGRIDGCHIELHDVRFVVGTSIEDTLPQLRQQWFGRRRGLHIDSWLAVRAVAGWRVELHSAPSAGPERLWFVNRGGYDPSQLAEQHALAWWWRPRPRLPRPGLARCRCRGECSPTPMICMPSMIACRSPCCRAGMCT